MLKIPCICVDDKKKPSIIPDSLWVKESKKYHITHVYKMVNQNNIQGCDIAEHDISAYAPYNCYRMDRFAIRAEDLPALFDLIKACTELDDFSIDELLESMPVLKEELV